ncbi:hypothetical protein [Streptosporangium longisporum]
MEFLVILTLNQPVGSDFRQITISQIVKASPGSTRVGLLSWAIAELGEDWKGSNVLFFSAEPNTLPTSLGAVKS